MPKPKAKLHKKPMSRKDVKLDAEPDADVNKSAKSDEELEVDMDAYRLYHVFRSTFPCLSFDVIHDLGDDADDSLTCYLVAGTQAERIRDNAVVLMKLYNIHERKGPKSKDDEESSSSEDDDDETDKAKRPNAPKFCAASMTHHGDVNRIRATTLSSAHLCASWNDQGKVHIWNLATAIRTVDSLDGQNAVEYLRSEKPLYTFSDHRTSGFAMDWSPKSPGRFASGDVHNKIYVWRLGEGGTWSVSGKPYDHGGSVDDIQWSPTEADVFASCGTNKQIRLWDCRSSPAEACITSVDAHDSDVNVISWNQSEPLIVSGGDDCCLKVWDLRLLGKSKQSVATFKHHTGPITSVQWSPSESTMFAASGADDQLTVWDLALELDTEDETNTGTSEDTSAEPDVPAQLLFVHQGQKEIKEISFHKKRTGVIISTALDGFNLFRTINM